MRKFIENNKWLLVIGTLLTMVAPTLIWAGSTERRISHLEDRNSVYEQDHDIILRLDTQMGIVLERLKRMDQKLDDLKDE